MPGSAEVWFATSNDHKFEEASYVLKDFAISVRRLSTKGSELQSSEPSEIAAFAASQAFRSFRRPLIVEDTGFFIQSLQGFPATYASYAFRTIGIDGILRLLQGANKRDAEFLSAVSYCEGPAAPITFTGRLKGKIALRPSGEHGFGFDPIFVPTGERRTLAEMSLAQKCVLSHRALALRAFGTWLKSRRSG